MMKRLHRTYRFILGAIFAFSLLLVLNAALPALGHNGVVHGDDSEPAQVVPTEPQTIQTDSTSTDADAATTAEPPAAAAQSDTKQTETKQAEATQASIDIGELLLGAIVLGPIALTQLRVKRSQ